MKPNRRATPGAASPGPSAYDRAMRMLARREYSSRELRTRLTQLGHAEAEVTAALARLDAAHYQDDQRFAEMLLRSRIAQGYGPLRLHAELKSHVFADARIRELLDAVEVDWDACAVAQLRRRYGAGSAGDRGARARRAQFLLRRGFAAATVRAATQADTGPSADPES
jgi:regulatory protein